jgi:hypothetical protein
MIAPPRNSDARGAAGIGEAEKQAAADEIVAHCAKSAAVALFLYGILPLERVQAMFRRNPAWRSA